MSLTKNQEKEIEKINKMSHEDMCMTWRHSASGHPYFDNTKPYAKVFKARLFDHFGGFTPKMSKKIGW